ncbi:MAG TPA: arginine--tRNA ligase [Candidatus Woesearchaeota archaeon]|nr:arginine--tRNA ligase [Candidatus Woesearchaeota archaeon]
MKSQNKKQLTELSKEGLVKQTNENITPFHKKIRIALAKIIIESLQKEEQYLLLNTILHEKESKHSLISSETKELLSQKISEELEIPPNLELGNFAYPCFKLSSTLKKPPIQISKELSQKISGLLSKPFSNSKEKLTKELYYIDSIKSIGPYLNFYLNKSNISKELLSLILTQNNEYGKLKNKNPKTILIESPGPNTNKPLHLGHLRNMLLGDSISKILAFYGNDIHIVNIINDRGIHICKSMLAYQKLGENKTPKSENIKSDHFVGNYYVLYSKIEKENPEVIKEAEELLIKWENEDPKVIKLWEKMNKWAIEGFQKTYNKLGFNIEKDYFESQIYKKGREIILEGLKQGIFQKDESGAIIADLKDKSLGQKVLLRANGTSVYITQDIYLSKQRYDEYKYDKMIYVVANEQERHFQTLFEILKKLKYEFANNCIHFSYGMVELPEGKMKSREGNVIDTDDLIEQMSALSKEEIQKRYSNLTIKEINNRAEKIALCAIKFFFLKFDPARNFVFNPQESLSFEGETGPYIQYTYARIKSIEKNVNKTGINFDFDSAKDIKKALGKIDCSLLDTPLDFELISLLLGFEEKIESASINFKPSILARYALDLSQCINKYYHTNRVLEDISKEDPTSVDNMPTISLSRLMLLKASALVLKNTLVLFGIDVLDEM